MIDLDEQELQRVRRILAEIIPCCEVRMFGSRVRGTARKFSDIDLVVVADQAISDATLSRLLDAFSESDLPYRVDVVDWNRITPEFRRTIEEQGFAVIQERP